MPLETVIFPVAGLGTRLYPLTENFPKALILVKDRPLLDYAFEEAVKSGFKKAIVVAHPNFRREFEEYLSLAKERYPDLESHLVFQDQPFGTGHVLLAAAPLVQDDFFIVRYCDDLLLEEKGSLPALLQMKEAHQKLKTPLILLEEVPMEEAHHYGVIKIEADLGEGVFKAGGLVEKPKDKENTSLYGSSAFAVLGVYVLSQEALHLFAETWEEIKSGATKDSLKINLFFETLSQKNLPFYGLVFKGKRFDCGNLEGLEKAKNHL